MQRSHYKVCSILYIYRIIREPNDSGPRTCTNKGKKYVDTRIIDEPIPLTDQGFVFFRCVTRTQGIYSICASVEIKGQS